MTCPSSSSRAVRRRLSPGASSRSAWQRRGSGEGQGGAVGLIGAGWEGRVGELAAVPWLQRLLAGQQGSGSYIAAA